VQFLLISFTSVPPNSVLDNIPVNSFIINLVLEVHCDLYIHRIDNCSLREGSRVGVFFLGAIVYLFS